MTTHNQDQFVKENIFQILADARPEQVQRLIADILKSAENQERTQ